MLEPPGHITAARITDPKVRFAWDEWKAHSVYQPADQALQERLQDLTRRAAQGFMLACGEWIAYRFEGLHDATEPLERLEAGWAALADPLYSFPFQTEDDEWRGPILGPLNLMMAIVSDGLYNHDMRTEPALAAAWMAKLAEHVLPDLSAFHAWRDACLARLEHLYPAPPASAATLFDEHQLDGEPVPRELYDPTRHYDPAEATQLIARFLVPLEDSENYFLGTPEEMLDAGFVGTPYRWPPEPPPSKPKKLSNKH